MCEKKQTTKSLKNNHKHNKKLSAQLKKERVDTFMYMYISTRSTKKEFDV